MKPNSLNRRLAQVLAISSVLFACLGIARADTLTWSGNGTTANWSDSINWTNSGLLNAVPATGDNLVFNGALQQANNNDLAGLTAGWLLFDAFGFSIGGNPLTTSGGITNSATAGGATVGMNITLGASQAFASESGALMFSGAITNAGNNLTVGGADATSWTMDATRGIKGAGSLIKEGAGTLTVAGGFLNPGPNLDFSGSTVVNAGSLQLDVGVWANYSAVGSALTINPGAQVNTTQPHFMGATGVPLYMYGGTLNMGAEAYVTTVVLSNATISSTVSPPKDIRGNGGLTNLASVGQTTFGAALNLGFTRPIYVEEGAADPDIEFTANIFGAGNLNKYGPGKMAVSAESTVSGNVLVNAGTLALTGSGRFVGSPLINLATNTVFNVSAVGFWLNTNQTLAGIGTVIGTVNDSDPSAVGSAISPGGSAVGTLTMDGLNLSGNSVALNFNLANVTTVGGGVNDLITVTNLTLSSGNTNTVNFAFSGTPAAGAYTLITYPAGQGPAAGPVYTLAAAPTRSIYTFSSSGTAIQVTVSANPAQLVWRGDGTTNTWDLGVTTNWMNGLVKDAFLTGDNATFNDSGSNTPAINLVGALPASVVTVAGSKDYTLAGSGRISGGARLNKTSSGTLTILTGNDNTGGGSLSGGPVNVGNVAVTGNLGSGNLTNNTTVNFNQAASSTYAGNMSGTGGVNVYAPGGTVSFTGTNTFSGGLTVQAGSFQVGLATPPAGASISGPITNYGAVYFSRSDAFTNKSPITSAGITRQFGLGDLYIRGAGGMAIDGTAPISVAGTVSVGRDMYGKLTVLPAASLTANNFLLGNPASSIGGEVVQLGGTVNALANDSSSLRIGHWATEISRWTMGGGSLNVAGQLSVGWDGIGLLNLTNGTITCGTLTIDNPGFTAAIGGTNSVFTMTGGQLNVGTGGITGNTQTNTDVNNIRLSGGTIAPLMPAGFSSSMAMTLTNGSPTFDIAGGVVTLTGVLSGNGGLTKQGAGYLSLNGANTFTNPVTVADGTLQGTGTIISPVTVQSGAALSAGGTLGTGTLTVSNATFNPGAGLVIDLSSTAATSDLLAAKGTLTLDAATPVTFNFLGGTPFTGGAYTIVTNWVPRTGALTYVNPTRYGVTLDNSQGNRIQVTFSGNNAGLVWNGNVNNLWNLNTTANWLNGSAASTYYQSDVVVFDNNGIGTPNVSLASDMTPAGVTVNSSGNYAFSGGALSSVGSLVKSGSGILTLANNASFANTVLNEGTLQIGDGSTTGNLTGNVANYASLLFNRSDASTYAGVISGPGTLTQAGAGTLLLTGNNTFYGGTTIGVGKTIQVGNGLLADSGVLGIGLVNNLGSLIYNRVGQITVAAPHTGNGSLTFLGTGFVGQSSYALNGTNTFTGPVTLSNARLVSGAGALSFGSPSSITVPQGSGLYLPAVPYSLVYSIPVTVSGGGWWESSGALGALRLAQGANWAGPITLAGNTRLSAYNDGNSNVLSGTISGPYELELGVNASGFLSLAPSSPNSFSALRLSPGTVWLGNANALPTTAPLTMNGGTLKLNGNNYSPSTFTHLANGSIQNGSSTSPATVTLNPPYNASFTLGSTFANNSTQPLNVTINQSGPGALINLSGDSGTAWTGNFTNNGGAITVSAGTNTRLGANNVATRFLVFNDCTFNTTINNAIAGGNATEPTVILNNSTVNSTRFNAYGPIVLNASTLTGNIGTSDNGYWHYALYAGKVTVMGSAPSYMAGTGASAGYALANPTIFNVADVAAGDDLTVTAPLRSGGGSIGGSGGVVKTGAGTMLVDSVATYTGSTVVSNGVLAIGVNGSLATSSRFNIQSGATLDASAVGGLTLGAQTLSGSGTVVGNVTDGTGSVIAPGSDVGTLTVNGDLALYGGGSLAFELSNNTSSGNDRLQVNGALTLIDSTPTPVNFTFVNGAPAAGTYTLINFTSLASGSAAGLTNTQGYNVSFAIVGNSVQATFAAAPAQSLVWQGGDSLGNNWDITVGTTNWFNGAADTNFIQLDTVRFDDSRTTVNTTIAVTAAVNPASITFDSTNDYVFNGAGKITGVTTITKNNTNTVTLGVVNDAIGTITINAGMLKANSDTDDSYDGATLITVKNGGAFNFDCSWDNQQKVPHNFVIEGSGPDGLGAVRNTTCSIASYSFISNMTLTADAVLGAQARWDIGPMAGSTVDGGGYKLIKTGADGLGFRPQFITNLAALVITNGRLWHENYDRTNTWDTTITNYATSGGRLGIYGGRTFAMPVVLDAGQIYNEGGGTPTWNSYIRIDSGSVFNNGGAQNFYGQIDGSGAMWVDGGTSALTLTNANTYAGGTVISNAPVTTAAANAASGGAAVIARDPSALGTGPVTIDGTAYSALSANPYFFRTNVLRAVEFAIDGPATVANNIILPSVTVSNASLHGRDATRVINLTGAISGGFSGFTNWIDFGAAGNGVIRYANPANNFIGTVSVFRGILGITADGALGNSANVVRLNSGALRFDAPNVNLAHGLFATASGSTLYLIGDNNGDGTLDTANNVTISGVISGGTAFNVRGTNGVLTLTGNNTMTSGYELLEPVTLEVASGANLGTAAAYVALKGGSTFRYTGTGTETWTRSIWNDTGTLGGGTIDIPNASASLTWNGGGTINQALSKTGAGSLTITAPGISGGILTVNGGAMTVNSVISGAGTLVQVNTGTLTLGGANTYGGPTLVSGGSLFVNGSIPAANAVTVASGGTLAGNGTINCPVDLQAGSALRPGAGPNTIGTLTVKSPLAMAGTTTTTMEIDGTGGTGDAVVAMSTVTYGGALTVNNTTGTPAPGTKFTLFSAVDRLGAFTTVTLPPATPPSYWTNLLAIDGSIQYVSPVSQTPVPVTWGISGGNLNLSWPTDHIGWRLLVQTNALNVGLVTNSAAWTAWPNSENVNSVSIPVNSANGTVFYKLVYP